VPRLELEAISFNKTGATQLMTPIPIPEMVRPVYINANEVELLRLLRTHNMPPITMRTVLTSNVRLRPHAFDGMLESTDPSQPPTTMKALHSETYVHQCRRRIKIVATSQRPIYLHRAQSHVSEYGAWWAAAGHVTIAVVRLVCGARGEAWID
jgi:hypothetical protein